MKSKNTLYRFSVILPPLLILFFTLGSVVGEPNTTDKIVAEADADVDSTKTSSNTGGQSYLEISDSTNMFQGIHIGYIRFDISTISGTVTSAILKLYTGAMVSETHSIGVHVSSVTSWGELTINYENKPAYEATPLDTKLVASTSTWYSWTVTTAVSNALTIGKICFAIISEDQHETASVWFQSRDQQYSWMEQYRPYLEVDTTTTPPSTSNDGDPANTTEDTPGFLVFSIFTSAIIVIPLINRKRKI